MGRIHRKVGKCATEGERIRAKIGIPNIPILATNSILFSSNWTLATENERMRERGREEVKLPQKDKILYYGLPKPS